MSPVLLREAFGRRPPLNPSDRHAPWTLLMPLRTARHAAASPTTSGCCMCPCCRSAGRHQRGVEGRKEEHKFSWLSPEPVVLIHCCDFLFQLAGLDELPRRLRHRQGRGGCAPRVLAPTTASPSPVRLQARTRLSPAFSTPRHLLQSAPSSPQPRCLCTRCRGGLSLPKKSPCKEAKSKCGEGNGDAQRKHSVSGLMARSRRLWSRSKSPSEELRVHPCARSCSREEEERQKLGTCL
ncbi:uncharacterized protein WM294_012925 [Sarcoramphus papa]